MRDSMRFITSILAMPFILVATFVVFWVVVGLTLLESILSIPVLWLEAAKGKFSDGTFPMEEKLADHSVGAHININDSEEPLTNLRQLNLPLHPLPDAS